MLSIIFDRVQRLVKWVLPFYLFTFLPLSLFSQTLTGSAPSHVSVGEQFRLTYTINTQNVSDFRAGDIPEELEVLIGPNRSMQSSYQMINGHTSSSSSITYTYIVCATKNGSFTIPPAHVVVGGKSISSNSLTIKVSGTAQSNNGGGSSRQRRQDDEGEVRDAGSRISGSDLFIKVSANKKRVYEQEPILLTYKVYTLVGLTSLRGDMPDLKSFYTQEVSLPTQKSFSIETFNGRPYKTTTWSQYVMFPQMTGKLQIPSITFEGVVVQQNRNIDPFEAFFNGGSGYVEVKKKIVAPSVEIQVDPLPERPAGFSGGVGHFNISAQLNKTETKANDPVSLRLTISGAGNLKLIKQPQVNLPKDFDKYEQECSIKNQRDPYFYFIISTKEGKAEEYRTDLAEICKKSYETRHADLKTIYDGFFETHKNIVTGIKVCTVFLVISLLCIIITVYSSIALETRGRQKEVAIRKVNGAKTRDIVMLFSRYYIVTLCTAYVLSLLIGVALIFVIWITANGLHGWTSEETRVCITCYLESIATITLVTLLTVWQKIYKISHINPALLIKKE